MKNDRYRQLGFALLMACSLSSYIYVSVQAQDLPGFAQLSANMTESSEIVKAELSTVKLIIGKIVDVITLPEVAWTPNL